ncbi:MAG TPA: mucoidy inhibitor MuiA family protein, partial [Alphaproteobacteria bacterium]
MPHFRTLPLFAILISTVSAFPVFAADISADSQLRAATVYADRATLTRQAVVDIPAGANVVVFSGLPANIMADTLRAEGEAASSVTFGALTHKMVAGADLAAPQEKDLVAQLEGLQDQRAAIEGEKQALTARKAFLDNLSQQAVLRARENIAEIDLKPEQWDAASKAIQTGTAEVLKGQLAQDVALRDIDRKIQAAQSSLNQIQTGQRNTIEVRLPLESKTATKLTLDLSYQVAGAGWKPLYDARLDTENGKLDLVQYGAVRQVTGEDWNDIALTLSTAQPSRGASLPDLDPYWIDLYDPNMATSRRASALMAQNVMTNGGANFAAAPPAMEMEANADKAVMEKVEPIQAVFETAQIETGGFVNEYKIKGPATVKADGTEDKLMIGATQIDSKLRVHVKPKFSNEAYLVASATLSGDAILLPGQVSLFRDGAFIGEDSLPLLRPGEKRDLPFGVDDQIVAHRRVLKDERNDSWVVGMDNVLERRFVLELQNLHKTPVEIVVMQTVPVPRNEDIDVE